MTGERHQFNALVVAWVAVGLTAVVSLGAMTRDYFNDRTEIKVTGVVTTEQVDKLSKQGEKLTDSITALNLQIAAMPSMGKLDALSARLDTHEGKIADLYNLSTGLRHDLDNRLPPPVYRNPQH